MHDKFTLSWFKVNLGDAMLAASKLDNLRVELTNIYNNAANKNNLLAVYRHENNGLHCDLIIYLTDELQQLANLDSATPCFHPDFSDTSSLINNENLTNR